MVLAGKTREDKHRTSMMRKDIARNHSIHKSGLSGKLWVQVANAKKEIRGRTSLELWDEKDGGGK